MALNPVTFAAEVNENFIRYQLTTFPLADERLERQMREQLEGRGMAGCPLFKGPYVSLEKAFKRARTLQELADEGLVHPALPGLSPHPQLFAHQERVLEAVQAGRHVLVTTGTGSGKTEAFLYPILDLCLRLRDEGAPPGIVAIVLYPMNALALDQLERLRGMLAGSGITFGMYTGRTPRTDDEVNVVRMKEGEPWREADRYWARHGSGATVVPWEERHSEAAMREEPPRILLTNPYQLEYLLTRGRDLPMFAGAPLEFIVVDEAHRYGGAFGAEVACLIRRLRAVAGKGADDVICMGTSATVAGEDSEAKARRFVHRFFGVDPERIEIVQEEYIEQEWPADSYLPPEEPPDAAPLLERIVAALRSAENGGDGTQVLQAAEELTGRPAPEGDDWPQRLYELLVASRYVRELTEVFVRPKALADGVQQLQQRIGRRTYGAGEREKRQRCEAEALCYFALGAAARKGENILLRPKLHYFVSGLTGVVAVFPPDKDRPVIYLSEEEAGQRSGDVQPTAIFRVLVCKTCGQHYFEGHYADFECDGKDIGGGTAEEDNVVWQAVQPGLGQRVVFTDTFAFDADEHDEELSAKKRTAHSREMWICRYCGALHGREAQDCHFPKCRRKNALVRVWVLLAEEGQVQRCPSCGQRGGRYRGRWYEPVKPVQAVEVADVHILAQNMINAMPDKRQRKLLIFADNRQDAAFQAGWIEDHARRYRLRHLLHGHLSRAGEPVSVTELVEFVAREIERDPDLAQALVPEVIEQAGMDRFGTSYAKELRYFLRLMVLRELATSFKQRQGLENWGLMRVEYHGISPQHAAVQRWAEKLALTPRQVADGISSLLDVWRRNRFVYDEQTKLFSRSWRSGDREIQAGYIPHFDMPPKGLLLEVPGPDRNPYAVPVLSSRGQTGAMQLVAKWGLTAEQAVEFLEELWPWLVDELKVLVPVDFRGTSGDLLKRGRGIYQIDTAALGLVAQRERYVCSKCRRLTARPTPTMTCTGWHCGGTLRAEPAPEDDYNVRLLQREFFMLRAREHSAQVPGEKREEYEEEFKREPPGAVNCLVCTPTLELGVDIGTLDMTLMRNVPPTPANYWQRVGRSGRRHRMGVNYTYCRRSSHDRYFFADPLQMLAAPVEPPRFNLDNEVLVAKHVRATVLTELLKRMADAAGSPQAERMWGLWEQALPTFIREYVFDRAGQALEYRDYPPDVATPLAGLIADAIPDIVEVVRQSFAQHWPDEAADQVADERIAELISQMPQELQRVVDRIHRRMYWALTTLRRLSTAQIERVLVAFEETLLRRCRRFLKGLSQEDERNYTLRVLSVEGFLPGYGMYEQGAVAFAGPEAHGRARIIEFQISRPDTIAVREFVPGNLIYANGGRFRLSGYRLPVREEEQITETFMVSVSQGLARPADDTQASPLPEVPSDLVELDAIPISDCDIVYMSRITDEEQYRFQIPVTTLGTLLHQHRGGAIYSWAGLQLKHMRGQRMRMLNAGVADRAAAGELGYPVCTVCGAVRSPYASEAELQQFEKRHTEQCQRKPKRVGLFAEVEVDGFVLSGFATPVEAVNFAEALRMGAESILEMERDDLQILSLPQADSAAAFLYDPMPGGSGLLDELLARWTEAVEYAIRKLRNCSLDCDTSCYGCMRTYYNAQWHSWLDRHKAAELLLEHAEAPRREGTIDPQVPSVSDGEPTNPVEERFLQLLQERGIPLPDSQVPIEIPGFGTVTPDFAYTQPARIAVFIDGLSKHLHGDPQRHQRDQAARALLTAHGWQVVAIPASALSDPQQLEAFLTALRTLLRHNG